MGAIHGQQNGPMQRCIAEALSSPVGQALKEDVREALTMLAVRADLAGNGSDHESWVNGRRLAEDALEKGMELTPREGGALIRKVRKAVGELRLPVLMKDRCLPGQMNYFMRLEFQNEGVERRFGGNGHQLGQINRGPVINIDHDKLPLELNYYEFPYKEICFRLTGDQQIPANFVGTDLAVIGPEHPKFNQWAKQAGMKTGDCKVLARRAAGDKTVLAVPRRSLKAIGIFTSVPDLEKFGQGRSETALEALRRREQELAKTLRAKAEANQKEAVELELERRSSYTARERAKRVENQTMQKQGADSDDLGPFISLEDMEVDGYMINKSRYEAVNVGEDVYVYILKQGKDTKVIQIRTDVDKKYQILIGERLAEVRIIEPSKNPSLYFQAVKLAKNKFFVAIEGNGDHRLISLNELLPMDEETDDAEAGKEDVDFERFLETLIPGKD